MIDPHGIIAGAVISNPAMSQNLFTLRLSVVMYYAFNIKVAGLARRRKFPLFISQDGTPVHEGTQQQAQSYEEVGS